MDGARKTVVVTGASGFVARHIVKDLLERGYRVRGSLRRPAGARDLRDAIRPHLTDPTAADTLLDFVKLDLTEDAGWSDAMTGAHALIHTASPFPLAQPDNRDDLILPAVEGTERALRAASAAGVRRVVLTSSVAAVVSADPLDREAPRTERDWTDPDHPATTAYAASKTLAERAAWSFAARNPVMRLTTVNPGLVLGVPLGGSYGSSVALIERVMKGRDPAVPRLMLDVVDVADAARMHVAAMESDRAAGQRLICTAGALWMSEATQILKAAYPRRRIPTRTAPRVLMQVLAKFDPAIRSILPMLGQRVQCDAGLAREVLSFTFTPPEDTILATARYLVDQGKV